MGTSSPPPDAPAEATTSDPTPGSQPTPPASGATKPVPDFDPNAVAPTDEHIEPVASQPSFEEQQALAAANQSPGETQVVPEVRPQAFMGTDKVSEASKRLDNNVPPTQEEYDAANSDENVAAAAAASRMPNLLVGQRVQITDGPEKGRMAYVLQVLYTTGLQGMLANSGQPEARFAEVDEYVVRTRDGRSDILSLKPDQVSALDDIQGWGRGQI